MQKAAMKMLDIALDSRKNELVINVLQETLYKENKGAIQSDIDQTDSRQTIYRNEAFEVK